MEYEVHIVDAISMEDGKPPAPRKSLLEELLFQVDAEERRRLLKQAEEEDRNARPV